ncbi:NAD(P)(+) transhydrogenase (Re/Si-specific) subunit beta [Sphingomonas jatrophae]|uniref:NAD(P)(+) transhydrogenase (Re/Si-specific) subunit beta n=1 Tax=Sphingomonas jatrophae TaxID=1166337 RepID=UPI0013F4D3CB|nr:NAD(P)(+) transhydrogenase (Re/Si-specific) subunit beta [Sphingomonas jatrophae]
MGDEPVDAVRAGFVGIDSPIFYNANTQMLFSDAKAMTGRMVKELSGEDSIKQCG